LQNLNPQQKKAVRHTNNPLLVLAGAGSGKTSVIAHKISYLIKSEHIDPKKITAITFTNRAAKEMRNRITLILGSSMEKPRICTFHTLGLTVLRAEYALTAYRPGFSILDSSDAIGIITELLRKERRTGDIAPNLIQHRISSWKSLFLLPEEVTTDKDRPFDILCLAVYKNYLQTLLTYNAVDFDDLIMIPVKILSENNEARDRWQLQIEYLLVDEYQDTNAAQYKLIKILTHGRQNLTVVGDDDQSIYGWRGADPENLTQLQNDYPTLEVIKLEQNYRSSGSILKAANALIQNNPHDYPKKLWSVNGFGDPLRVISAATEHDEAERIANDIIHRQLLKRESNNAFAVLIRSNHQGRLFERAFLERNIPYTLSGGQSFFDYTEIKDCICYMRLVSNSSDNNALLRILNIPRRGIGAQSVKMLVEGATQLELSILDTTEHTAFLLTLPKNIAKKIRSFGNWVKSLKDSLSTTNPDVTLSTLLADIGYEEWLVTISEDEKEFERRNKNVQELLTWIKNIVKKEPSIDLAGVVSSLTLFDIIERQDNEKNTDSVSITTLHAAKGLEYSNVYIAGFEEGILPHRNSITEVEIQEERRVAYVGITRAKKTLTLTYSKTRKRYGQIESCEPSRFLEELPEDEIQWSGKKSSQNTNKKIGLETIAQLRMSLKNRK
jgi:ATP-dependent DNA helicase Rep